MNLQYDDIVYLDNEFLYAHYEKLTGKKPIVSLSKSEGGEAGVQLPVLGSKISTMTTKQYKASTIKILEKVLKKADRQFLKPDELNGNELGWIKGDISVGKWRKRKNFEVTAQEEVVELNYENWLFTMLYQPECFLPGYSALITGGTIVRGRISFPVEVYGKVVKKDNPIQTIFLIPFIIIRNS